MKFDDDFKGKSEVNNGDINTRVNELTDEIQEWCTNNYYNPYSEWMVTTERILTPAYLNISRVLPQSLMLQFNLIPLDIPYLSNLTAVWKSDIPSNPC